MVTDRGWQHQVAGRFLPQEEPKGGKSYPFQMKENTNNKVIGQ